jgi:O-antigen ligase
MVNKNPLASAPFLSFPFALYSIHHFSRVWSFLSERAQLWGRTLDMAKDHPFLGMGPAQWRIV